MKRTIRKTYKDGRASVLRSHNRMIGIMDAKLTYDEGNGHLLQFVRCHPDKINIAEYQPATVLRGRVTINNILLTDESLCFLWDVINERMVKKGLLNNYLKTLDEEQ